MNKVCDSNRLKYAGVGVLLATLVSACTLTPHRAPVEDRTGVNRSPVGTTAPNPSVSGPGAAASAPVEPVKVLPGAENAGKPGYYSVKPGDTLIRIGLENGQNWKDLIKWNNLDNPNVIEVGQVLRVVQPGVDANAASSRPVTTARVDTKPLDARVGVPVPAGSAASAAPTVAPSLPSVPAVAPVAMPSVAREGDDDVSWSWPSGGGVVSGFDEGRAKGLVFGGRAGDAVLAAADGKVVYAGAGLRGYGNLIILKHNNTYLTAYAHNQALLVKEEQNVRRGQKIAEMGATDSDTVKLHFEIRKQGKPIDPAKLLPPR